MSGTEVRDIADILRSHPFVAGLDDEIVKLVAGCAHNVVFPAGHYLLREGEEATHFHLLRHGSVALEMHVPGRGTLTFQTLGEGELLGANWLVPPYRWYYDARAVTLVRALEFDASCLREKCEADHHVGYEMMKRFLVPMVERLQVARLQVAHLFDEQRYASGS